MRVATCGWGVSAIAIHPPTSVEVLGRFNGLITSTLVAYIGTVGNATFSVI